MTMNRTPYQRFRAVEKRIEKIRTEPAHECTHRRVATLKYALEMLADEEVEAYNAPSGFDRLLARLTRTIQPA